MSGTFLVDWETLRGGQASDWETLRGGQARFSVFMLLGTLTTRQRCASQNKRQISRLLANRRPPMSRSYRVRRRSEPTLIAITNRPLVRKTSSINAGVPITLRLFAMLSPPAFKLVTVKIRP